MSEIALSLVKADLRVIHDDDDGLLQALLDAAEDEAAQFLNVSELPLPRIGTSSSDYTVAPSVYSAILLLVRSKYDAATAEEIAKLRTAAETILMPYRVGLGV